MDTIAPLPLIPSIDLVHGQLLFQQGGLSRAHVGFLGCVYFSIDTGGIDTVLDFLEENASVLVFVNAAEIAEVEDVMTLLDAGVQTVFVKAEHFNKLKEHGDRVLINNTNLSDQDDISGPTFTTVQCGNSIEETNLALSFVTKKSQSPVYVALQMVEQSAASISVLKAAVSTCCRNGAVTIVPGHCLTVENTDTHSALSVSCIISSYWATDRPDGLVPTIVTDERGVALGLVYSSQESLSESLRTGRGVYQSRKRGLWRKGESSGDVQELVRVSMDCDQDCLKFTVKQLGRGKLTSFLGMLRR
jgi:phosphoribosyl-ATP pyrophosphohydrolase/phosphoribosyl-AMP cyclohydrolase/histidinol dehydrogenase